jgi:hypothetical protein
VSAPPPELTAAPPWQLVQFCSPTAPVFLLGGLFELARTDAMSNEPMAKTAQKSRKIEIFNSLFCIYILPSS